MSPSALDNETQLRDVQGAVEGLPAGDRPPTDDMGGSAVVLPGGEAASSADELLQHIVICQSRHHEVE